MTGDRNLYPSSGDIGWMIFDAGDRQQSRTRSLPLRAEPRLRRFLSDLVPSGLS